MNKKHCARVSGTVFFADLLITDANHNTMEELAVITDMVARYSDGDGNLFDIAFTFFCDTHTVHHSQHGYEERGHFPKDTEPQHRNNQMETGIQ